MTAINEEKAVKSAEKKQVELCAIPKDFAAKKLSEITGDPVKRSILEEYFMWENILNSQVNLVNTNDELKVEDSE